MRLHVIDDYYDEENVVEDFAWGFENHTWSDLQHCWEELNKILDI